jgi:hypothetical protein
VETGSRKENASKQKTGAPASAEFALIYRSVNLCIFQGRFTRFCSALLFVRKRMPAIVPSSQTSSQRRNASPVDDRTKKNSLACKRSVVPSISSLAPVDDTSRIMQLPPPRTIDAHEVRRVGVLKLNPVRFAIAPGHAIPFAQPHHHTWWTPAPLRLPAKSGWFMTAAEQVSAITRVICQSILIA